MQVSELPLRQKEEGPEDRPSLDKACRQGRLLHASDGKVRPGSEGGAVRHQFTRLPGTGAGSAKTWYRAGARCAACRGEGLMHFPASLADLASSSSPELPAPTALTAP